MLVSHIGIGGCSAGSEYGPVSDGQSFDTIRAALKKGINFIDTSPAYGLGKSEEIMGQVPVIKAINLTHYCLNSFFRSFSGHSIR